MSTRLDIRALQVDGPEIKEKLYTGTPRTQSKPKTKSVRGKVTAL